MEFQHARRSDLFNSFDQSGQTVSNGGFASADVSESDVRHMFYDVPKSNSRLGTDSAVVPTQADAGADTPAGLAPAFDATDVLGDADHFEFIEESDVAGLPVDVPEDREQGAGFTPVPLSAVGNDGRGGTDPAPEPEPEPVADGDPDPAPEPVDPPPEPAAPTQMGRPDGVTAGPITDSPPSAPPADDNAVFGRAPDAAPEFIPDTGPLATYTSGGAAATSYNVAIDFVGTWSNELQAAFIEAADYLSTIVLADVPDVIVEGALVDDIVITATLAAIDGVGGTLGSAGPREIRGDGSYLPSTGAMTFDVADAQNQLTIGNWESIVLHEMTHAMGFGTLWSYMGLTSGSVAGGDMRFIGVNATETYLTEFPGIAGADPGAASGVPVETDGGPGTAGGHWDEELFNAEIMTGYVDSNSYVSNMTIAALEDMGYDTVFDDPYSLTDLFGAIPGNPLADLFA